jgi:exosortase E/protease (VPEID-CTERM system)
MITGAATGIQTSVARYAKLVLWGALVASQLLAISVLFDFATGLPVYANPISYVTRGARWAALGVPMFLVLVWTRRQQFFEYWSALERPSLFGWPLAVNAAAFALAILAGAAFTASATSTTGAPSWPLLALLTTLIATLALSQLALVMPFRSYGALLRQWHREAALAGVAALAIVLLSDAATYLWDFMAEGTLVLSAAILRLYEADVQVDVVEQGIRVGNFGVQIWRTCSGFEGLVLVAGFVTVYLWTFRNELSFPKALLLYPIGLAASWLLNSVRIAALVSIGAHYSPEMAVKGFHSQAGWIAFLGIALGLMALSRRLGLAAAAPGAVPATMAAPAASAPAGVSNIPTRYDATVGYLMPFVALMAGTVAMSVAAPHDQPVYALKAALVAMALWALRKRQGDWWRMAIPGTSIAAGLLVGVAWIATSPAAGTESTDLGMWLSELAPALAVAWLLVRGVGTILLVPIAEELAFRGFLYRRLIRRDFHLVGWTAFSWLALIGSSLVFGLLHDRWIAGALAGAVFVLLMLRGGRLGDAIAGHAIANALIFGWALAFRQWALL